MKCTFHNHIHIHVLQDQSAAQSSEQTPLITIRSDTKVGHALYPTNVHRRHKTQSQLNVGRTFSQLEQLNCV